MTPIFAFVLAWAGATAESPSASRASAREPSNRGVAPEAEKVADAPNPPAGPAPQPLPVAASHPEVSAAGASSKTPPARSPAPGKAETAAEPHPSRPALPTLSAVLRAFDRRENAQQGQRRVSKLIRRARRAAWLPQLVLTVESRQHRDKGRAQEVAAPLVLDSSLGQTQVLRGQMRWQLDRLVHHHSTLAALRLARAMAQGHRAARAEVARNYARFEFLWVQAGVHGWSELAVEEALTLRAELLAATDLPLPHPWAAGGEHGP